MFFHIMTKDNEPVFSGKLVFMRPHALSSKNHNELVFTVQVDDAQMDAQAFGVWSKLHLKITMMSDRNHIMFTSGAFSYDYYFEITNHRHEFRKGTEIS